MIGARPLEDDEVSLILQEGFTGNYEHRNRSLFATGLSTGFRISELLALEMRDIMHRKYPKSYVKIPKRLTKGKTQGRTQRLQSFARQALQPWIDERLEGTELADLLDEPVFLSREKDTRTRVIKPITPQHAGAILNQAFERCEIPGPVSTHSMRKTFAQKIYYDAVKKFRAGEIMIDPLRVCQQQLGHKTIQSTLSYLSFIGVDVDPDLFNYSFVSPG